MEKLTINAPGLDELNIEHALYTNWSPHLVAMLPGRNYTCDAPALHYLRAVALQTGCDVLSVRYSFQYAPNSVSDKEMKWVDLMSDVNQALLAVLDRGYTRLTLVGKSLGSPLAALWAQNSPIPDTRLILLTPVADAVKHAKTMPTLAIVGTADEAYNAADIAADQERPNIRWHIFDNLNHGLEYEEHWAESIRILGAIMALCEAFIKE